MIVDPFEPSRDEIRIPVPFEYARAAFGHDARETELLRIGTTDLGMWQFAFMEATASGENGVAYWATFRRADLPD